MRQPSILRLVAVSSLVALGLGGCSGGSVVLTPPTSLQVLAQQRIKHVFILVQENHTFDNYYGLYPGTAGQAVENLGTADARATGCQPDPETGSCQRPFLITTNHASPNYVVDAPDVSGGDNDRNDQEAGIDRGAMNGFLSDNERGVAPLGANPTAAQMQSHNQSISIEGVYDCDTVPYLWYYAKNFALFDHYFQAETGQSTPGNIQLFAGQIGQTELAAGHGTASEPIAGGGYSDGLPISNDDNPPASTLGGVTAYTPDQAQYQSYASLPVLFDPTADRTATSAGITGEIAADLGLEAKATRPTVPWAWYEEGAFTAGAGFSAHHTAPLYFDYINRTGSPFLTTSTLRDNTSSNGLISDINAGRLASSGVYWVKGGNANTYGFRPADPALTQGKQYYVGDDDHPGSGSSDHQVAEAYLATVINAIAKSSYWKDSVIIVTWDDSGGFYDHLAPPRFGATCQQDRTGPEAGYACGDGVRLPMLVISPFAKTGTVVHDLSDGGSIVKFVETIFGLPTLASLPNEAAGVSAGLAPADADGQTSSLIDALDPAKLQGAPVNPASLAEVGSPSVPPAMSCATLGLTPIPTPTSLPPGFETNGAYIRAAVTGQGSVAHLAPLPDDGD